MKKIYFSISYLLILIFLPYSGSAQCTNFSAFGSAVAPLSGIVTVTICQFAGEYSTITACAAGASYTSSTDLAGGYFTVRQGAPAGPVVGMGLAPLTWTSPLAGTYYVHLNTSALCGSDFSCHEVYIERACATLAPFPVTASPVSICSGDISNLNATRAGCTIYWYTVPSGGVSLGTSASGANFPVTPASTTTYYASAYNGSCFSNRSSVTVTVTPSPIVTSVISSPDTICAGDASDLTATACGVVSGFTSTYAPANWTTTHNPLADVGTVNPSGAPGSISMTSSNGGNFGTHNVLYTVTVPCSGNITFNWDYATTDVDGCHYDQPLYAINGVIMGPLPGWVDYGANMQSGSCVIPILAGQTFSLIMSALDDILGAATTVYSGFSGPGGSAGTMSWYTVPSGGATIGTTPSGVSIAMSPGGTTTYYVETWAAGCVSVRVPVVVVVLPCVLPVEWAYFDGESAEGSNHLHWGISSEIELSYFNLQRSADGLNYYTIGMVSADISGTPESTYLFEDTRPHEDLNYYRLEAVDLNGSESFSNTIVLNGTHAPSLYPNPAKDYLYYKYSGAADAAVEISIMDMFGRTLLTQKVANPQEIISVDLRALPPGSYVLMVKMLDSQSVIPARFIHH